MKVSCYQHMMDCFIYEMFYVKPHANHKAEVDNKCMKYKKIKEEDRTYHHGRYQFTKIEGNRGRKKQYKYKATRRLTIRIVVSPYLSIIILYVDGLNSPNSVNWYKVDGYTKIKKNQNLTICCLKEIHFNLKDTLRPTVKGYMKIFQASRNQKKVRVAILTSGKIV